MIRLKNLLKEESLKDVLVGFCEGIAKDIEKELKKSHKAKTTMAPVSSGSLSAWYYISADEVYTRSDLKLKMLITVEVAQGTRIDASVPRVRIEINHPSRGKIEEQFVFSVKDDRKKIVDDTMKVIDLWVTKS